MQCDGADDADVCSTLIHASEAWMLTESVIRSVDGFVRFVRFVSGVVSRRPAPRLGFRGECSQPTALHRLCRQWNDNVST